MIKTHGKMITAYCKSFLKCDNPILVVMLPKKPLQGLITVVMLLSYSRIKLDKSHTWKTLFKNYYNQKTVISRNWFPRK